MQQLEAETKQLRARDTALSALAWGLEAVILVSTLLQSELVKEHAASAPPSTPAPTAVASQDDVALASLRQWQASLQAENSCSGGEGCVDHSDDVPGHEVVMDGTDPVVETEGGGVRDNQGSDEQCGSGGCGTSGSGTSGSGSGTSGSGSGSSQEATTINALKTGATGAALQQGHSVCLSDAARLESFLAAVTELLKEPWMAEGLQQGFTTKALLGTYARFVQDCAVDVMR